jgi:chemotaxis protein methyltransferase CheR
MAAADIGPPPAPLGDGVDEPREPELDRRDVDALVDHLFVRAGIDFRRYARKSVERRIRHVLLQDGVASVAQLRARVAGAGAAAAVHLAHRLCVTVTTLFRDPAFWTALRRYVTPQLRTLPFVRVWSAGCATGEEAYSLAILLREEGLYARSRIYATDVDESALARARSGVFPLEHMREYTHNYVRGGGTAAFSEYYRAGAEGAALAPSLARNIVFAPHNLAADATFNDFQLILCRNVLIYFEASLQRAAHELLHKSLAPGGVLGLGLREVVPRELCPGRYDELDAALKLYRDAR